MLVLLGPAELRRSGRQIVASDKEAKRIQGRF